MSNPKNLVVLSAFSCAPNWGSEAEVGWRAVDDLVGSGYEVHVFVDKAYRKGFSAEQLQGFEETQIFLHFKGLSNLQTKLLGDGSFGRTYYYMLWQKRLAGWVRDKVDVSRVRLCHHVTWAKYSVPSQLWRLEAPLLIGPVGGGEMAPKELEKSLSLKGRVLELIRRTMREINAFSGVSKDCLNRAALVWASTEETKDGILKIAPDAKVEVRTQISSELASKRACWENRSRVVSVGRFIGWKGFWLILEAFFAASDEVTELVLVGGGPDEGLLKKRADELSRPGKKVTFCGWLDEEGVKKELASSGIFCFGSLHDSAGFVVLEALGSGLPVVCLAAGGPALLTTPDCGILVQPNSTHKVVSDLAEGLSKLAGLRQEEWNEISEASLSRAREFTPSAQRSEKLKVYEQILRGDQNLG